jgi:ribosomal protein S18 acetylase RimI-like enzyme
MRLVRYKSRRARAEDVGRVRETGVPKLCIVRRHEGSSLSARVPQLRQGPLVAPAVCGLNQVAEQKRGYQLTAAIDQLQIRPFERSDTSKLEELWGKVFVEDPPWNAPANMIANKLEVQPELLLVGMLDQVLVGAVMAGYDGVRGWIYHLAVAPEARRRGIATELVRTAETDLRKLGCSKVNLQIRASNSEGVAFYQKLGFIIEERVSMGRRLDGAG